MSAGDGALEFLAVWLDPDTPDDLMCCFVAFVLYHLLTCDDVISLHEGGVAGRL
jgi:hypothetical protein